MSGKVKPFPYAFNELVRGIRVLTKSSDDLNAVEPQLRTAFKKFLTDMDMPLALANFEALLKEKSGEKFLRNDGSVNWFHEFIPIMQMMELVHRGYKKGGVDLKDVEASGGLEAWICTHLRHDSLEDFKLNLDMIDEQYTFIDAMNKSRMSRSADSYYDLTTRSMVGIALMTQEKNILPDGTVEKEDVVLYTARMVYDDNANPETFMCKLGDVNHNFATMFGAEKFTPAKRMKRCQERIDMYDPTYGFTDAAMAKWPAFRKAIKSMDSMMGFMVYPHKRYLGVVDQYGDNRPSYPVGIERYIHDVLAVQLPEAIHPAHIFLKRMMKSVDPVQDPEKFERLQHFMIDVMRPALAPYKDRFPYFFKDQQTPQIAPAPAAASTALPPRAAYAPNMV